MELSIIIPCYNSEKFISTTLNALIDDINNQISFEIICIDDGSQDNTLKIIRTYSDKYPFLKVITQKNQGVSVARNQGLHHSVGKNVLFLDSDDHLDIKLVIENIKEKDFDFCYWGATKIWPSVRQINYPIVPSENSHEIIDMLCYRKFHMFMGGFCLSRKIAISIGFDTRFKYGEDLKFIILSICRANKIISIDECLLNYLQHNNSAMSKVEDRRFDSIRAIASLVSDINSKSIRALLYRDRITIVNSVVKEGKLSFFDLIKKLDSEVSPISWFEKIKISIYYLLIKVKVRYI